MGGEPRGAAGATCKIAGIAYETCRTRLATYQRFGWAVQSGSTRRGCYSRNGMAICGRPMVQSAPPPLRRGRRGHRHRRRSDQQRVRPHRAWRSSHRVPCSRGQVLGARWGRCWLLAQQGLDLRGVGGTQDKQHPINSRRVPEIVKLVVWSKSAVRWSASTVRNSTPPISPAAAPTDQ
jgi:hypothetical protein